MTDYALLDLETVFCVDKDNNITQHKDYPMLVTSYFFKGAHQTGPGVYTLDEFDYQCAISNLDTAEHWFKWGYQHGVHSK